MTLVQAQTELKGFIVVGPGSLERNGTIPDEISPFKGIHTKKKMSKMAVFPE